MRGENISSISPEDDLGLPRPTVPRHVQYPIWDTVDTHLASDERYSPRTAGIYTWPIEGEAGFYGTLYIGWNGPNHCEGASLPSVTYEGCFSRTSGKQPFKRETLQLPTKGDHGMTAEVRFECFLEMD